MIENTVRLRNSPAPNNMKDYEEYNSCCYLYSITLARNINSRSRLSWSVYPVGGIRNRGDQNSSKLSLQALASKTHFCMEEIFHFLFRFFSTYPHVNFFWFIAWVAGCITFCVVLHCVLCLHWAVPEKAFGLLNCNDIWQNTKYLLKSNVQVQWKMNYTCRNKKGWNRIKNGLSYSNGVL